MKIAKVRDVKTPTRGTTGSAGIDFYIPNDYPDELCTVKPGERFFIPSGIKANVPEEHALIAMNKSGVALKKLKLLSTPIPCQIKRRNRVVRGREYLRSITR